MRIALESRGMSEPQIRTIWRTAAEQCELVWGQFTGCHVRLWVKNRLILEEALYNVDDALRRAWELRVEWPRLVD